MIAAEVQYEVMGRSLAIALVIAAPILYLMWRKFQRELTALELVDNPPVVTPVAANSLESVLSILADESVGLAPGEQLNVELPNDIQIDGHVAPQSLVEPLFVSECRQLGLTITEFSTDDNARHYVVVKERS